MRLPEVIPIARPMSPSCRFPPLREGNREKRAYSVPPASRGNLKEGVINCCFCELWLGGWYKCTSDTQRFLHAHNLLHNRLLQAFVLRLGDAQRLLDGWGQLVQYGRAQREPRLMRQHIRRVN